MPQKSSFLDPIIKIEKKKLGPQAYATHSSWKDDQSNAYRNGHIKKGCFQPRERPLITKEFMEEAKRKNIPAPGAYTIPRQDRQLLGFTEKAEKRAYHVDMAAYYAKQTPTVCYKKVEDLSNLIKPKIFAAKIVEPVMKKDDVGKKIPKDKGPDMGSYEVGPAQNYVAKRGLSQKWSTGPVVSFHDASVK